MNTHKAISMLVITILLAGCMGIDLGLGRTGNTPTDTPAATTPTDTPAAMSLRGRLTFAGSTTVQPLVEKLAAVYQNEYPDIELEIAAGGSVVGIQAVQEGRADIGMASRNIKPAEESPGMQTYQIAIDVLAIIVHPSNPVDDLSREQLREIYLGEIDNWADVGGPDMEIVPVIREVSSGTRGAFDEIALEGDEPVATADTQITAGEVETRVASTPEAIGYVGFGNVSDQVKVLMIDGVAPTPETARSDTYQLQRPLLLLLGPLSRPQACSFVTFALSETGQQMVGDDGWVGVNTSDTPLPCSQASLLQKQRLRAARTPVR